MYMVDSNIWVDIMRGRMDLGYELMRQSDPRQFKVPAIVAAELYYGAEHGNNPHRGLSMVDKLLAPYEIVPFDDVCARFYGQVRHELAARGAIIGGNDLLIAATALAHRAVLVTNNTREFRRVPGLSIESWHDISDIWQETAPEEGASD